MTKMIPPAARWRIAISKTNTAAILAPILCSYGFAYGLRNPPGFAWDPKNGRIFLTDIGQYTIEELDTLSADANLGWKTWEGSFRFVDRAVSLDQQRSDPRVTYLSRNTRRPTRSSSRNLLRRGSTSIGEARFGNSRTSCCGAISRLARCST